MKRVRIAIPVYDKKGLDDEVFEHFGHAPYYILVDAEDGEIKGFEVVENKYSEMHAPGDVPNMLARLGVNVLICRGIGPRARAFFEDLGIEVIPGAWGRVRDVVEAYLSGRLEPVEYRPKEKWGGGGYEHGGRGG